MALRGPRLLLLLALALLAVSLAELIPEPPNYERFMREHVDFPRTNINNAHHYCNTLIQRRGLPCSYRHTFIHAPPHLLQRVCSGDGYCQYPRMLCDSHRAFLLTTCRLVSTPRPLDCIYRGRRHTNRVRLACHGRLPVSFIRYL